MNLGPSGPALSADQKLQIRSAIEAMNAVYDTAANFAAGNHDPLAQGKIGMETDTRKFKIGDGTTAWTGLQYATVSEASELLTSGFTTGNFLRVAAEGGLEERTPEEVLGDIGAAASDTNTGDETKESILDKLKGAAADATRIGTEYMPEIIEVEYTLPQNTTEAVYPEGAITRVGTTLKVHDNVTPGGLSVGGSKNYIHTGGFAPIIPYGVAGSRAKFVTNGSTWYWTEIGRVVLPGSMIKNGNILSFDLALKFQSGIAVGIANRSGCLVPAPTWDVEDQTVYFGATPQSAGILGTNTPGFLPFRIAASSSSDSTSRVARSHILSHDGIYLSAAGTSAGTYQYGYNYVGGTVGAWSSAEANGLDLTSNPLGDDLEFVIVVATTNNASDYRQLWYDLTMKATSP